MNSLQLIRVHLTVEGKFLRCAPTVEQRCDRSK